MFIIKFRKKCIQSKEILHFVPHLWGVLAWVPYVMLLCLYNRHGDTGWYWGHRVVGLGNLPYWNQPLSWSKSWKILDCKLPFFKYQSTVHEFWKVINTSDKHVTCTTHYHFYMSEYVYQLFRKFIKSYDWTFSFSHQYM